MGVDIGYSHDLKSGVEAITFVPNYTQKALLVNKDNESKIEMAKAFEKNYPESSIKIKGNTISFDKGVDKKDISKIVNAKKDLI